MGVSYRCPVDECGTDHQGIRKLVLHVRAYHSVGSKLSLPCPVSGCCSTFRSAVSYRKHITLCHSAQYKEWTAKVSTKNVKDHVPPDYICSDSDVMPHDDQVSKLTAAEAYENVFRNVSAASCKFRLHIEHSFGLPTSVASRIHDDAVHFSFDVGRQVGEVALLRLSEIGCFNNDVEFYLQNLHLLDTLLEAPKCENVHLLKELGYVDPVEYDLLDLAAQLQVPVVHAGPSKPFLYYVPILETLKSYLSHEDVLCSVLRERQQSENITGFTNGHMFREHPLFSQDPHALRIVLYTDELEVCNPLGGNTLKHKLCVVYFQLANIGPKHLSSLQSIHLVAICKWSYVVRFGYRVILHPLFRDVKILSSEGIAVKVKGEGGVFHFRGAVALCVGDNSSMHHLGGFNRSFSSGKVCRFCMTSYKDLCKVSNESECTLRTAETQIRHCELVAQSESAGPIYGVFEKSPLLELPHFSVPDGLPPDIMHDVLEKVLCLNVKAVLKGLNKPGFDKQRPLSYKTVMRIHSSFKFAVIDKVNRPPELPYLLMRKKTPLRGSASQKWHLFHFLSLILGPHVPEGNLFWKLHLLLNRICDIIFAVVVTEYMLYELEELVRDHHNLWVQLVSRVYPPKLHYLIHYARLMFQYGPLRHLWCMRFEAFHQYIKTICQRCKNFINIGKTASRRVQMKRCLDHSGDSIFPPSVQTDAPQLVVTLGLLPSDVQQCISKAHCTLSSDTTLSEVKYVTVDGLLVRQGFLNVIDERDGDPAFLKVLRVFIISDEVFVYGSLTVPRSFNDQLHAFEVILDDSSDNCVCVHASVLLPAQTLNAYEINGKFYVKLRFSPCHS